jgi:hypothetical protein
MLHNSSEVVGPIAFIFGVDYIIQPFYDIALLFFLKNDLHEIFPWIQEYLKI